MLAAAEGKVLKGAVWRKKESEGVSLWTGFQRAKERRQAINMPLPCEAMHCAWRGVALVVHVVQKRQSKRKTALLLLLLESPPCLSDKQTPHQSTTHTQAHIHTHTVYAKGKAGLCGWVVVLGTVHGQGCFSPVMMVRAIPSLEILASLMFLHPFPFQQIDPSYFFWHWFLDLHDANLEETRAGMR